MVKFNDKNASNTTVSYEEGLVYKRDAVQAWFNFLCSSFLENQYYETSTTQIERFKQLTEEVANKCGYTFVAKAAVFARNELGMRSISQLTAAWLNDKSFQEKRNFYKNFMRRPDDVSEVFGAVDFLAGFSKGKRSHALVKGAADYLSTISEYEITKYKMIGHKYNMYDVINITHANSLVINRFKRGELSAPDTWENKIRNAAPEDRDKEWVRLVEEHKLGYMALIRNLNNILNTNPSYSWIVDVLYPQIIDAYKIKSSLIFPYRLYTAYKSLKHDSNAVIAALEEAFRIAVDNVPYFGGKNAIVLDVSGSMSQKISDRSSISLKEVGACFAASIMLKGSDCDFIKFGTHAKKKNFSKFYNIFETIQKMIDNENLGYSTELYSTNRCMNDDYDRIFLISDMQILDGRFGSRTSTYWNKKHSNAITYSFDLANYSSQVAPPSNKNFVFLTSLNDSIFKIIKYLENENIVEIINNYINF